AIPGVSECHGRTDQRTIAPSRSLLKIEKERRATKEPTIAIAEKHRRTPLRTAHSPRFKTTWIRQTHLVRIQRNRTRVIKTLKDLNGGSRKPEGCRYRTHAMTVRVDVRSEVDEQISSRAIARVNVHRGKASRYSAVNKSRERIKRIKLVALIRDQSATKKRVEEILTAQSDRERFIRLT